MSYRVWEEIEGVGEYEIIWREDRVFRGKGVRFLSFFGFRVFVVFFFLDYFLFIV